MMIPTASFNASFTIWDCALTLLLSLKSRSFRNDLCICKHFFQSIPTRSDFHSDTSFIAYVPNVQMRQRGPGNDSAAHHKNLLDVCLDFCQMYLVDFLFSIITEVLLLQTCSLGFLLISELKKMCWFFFSVCFSTFSFHDLKKNVSTG